jgi:NADP-dependent alcohol dehydrogenase
MQVTRLEHPTAVLAGRDALASALAELPAGELAVLYDPAVEPLLAGLGRSFASRAVHRPPTFGDVEATAAWLAERHGAPLLAVGGGSVLDLAKLAAVAATSPLAVARLRRWSQRAGFAVLPAGTERTRSLTAVPTTIGTGAEVSAVACVDSGHGHRSLVYSRAFRPDLAVLDPAATRTLPLQLVREGALEALLRVAGPEVASPSAMPMARLEAHDLARRLAHALDACRDGAGDELRLELAQLSGATHRGWALTGRSPYPSPLWFVANELSMVLRVTKMAATTLLLPPWLQRVADGDARWGHRERLADLWTSLAGAPPERDVARQTRAQLARWRLTPSLDAPQPGAAREAAQRAVARWGGKLPMLGRFGIEDIVSLTGQALAA